jgi:hypothetical protein
MQAAHERYIASWITDSNKGWGANLPVTHNLSVILGSKFMHLTRLYITATV